MADELSPEGLRFIEQCLIAREQFDRWLGERNEYEIKVDFKSFALIMRKMDEIILEAQQIVRRDSS